MLMFLPVTIMTIWQENLRLQEILQAKAMPTTCRTNQHDIEFVYREILEYADIVYTKLPVGVEKHSRYADDAQYDFYLNVTEDTQTLSGIQGTDLLSDSEIDGSLNLERYQVAIIKH